MIRSGLIVGGFLSLLSRLLSQVEFSSLLPDALFTGGQGGQVFSVIARGQATSTASSRLLTQHGKPLTAAEQTDLGPGLNAAGGPQDAFNKGR